jgi:hypothetical protein
MKPTQYDKAMLVPQSQEVALERLAVSAYAHRHPNLAMRSCRPTLAMAMANTPKAKTSSSTRVRGFEFVNSMGGNAQSRKARQREKANETKRRQLGHLIVNGKRLGKIKMHQRAMENPGSWTSPADSKETQDFLSMIGKMAMTEEEIKDIGGLFFSGENKDHIDGVPVNCTVKPVNSLFVIDTVHGFKFPFSSDNDSILLVRREDVIADQPNQSRVLQALEALSNTSKDRCRGKDRKIAFQEGSTKKYLLPGVYPLRAGHGMGQRGIKNMEKRHSHDLFKYIQKVEKIALGNMPTRYKRGFNLAKSVYNYETFPDNEHFASTHMYSSIATALNVCLESHQDLDSTYSVVTTLEAGTTTYSLYDPVIQYFTFPTLGLAIALRQGDILFFDAMLYHSVSSRRYPNRSIWCTSLYTKNLVVGGNDNSLPLNDVQKKALEIVEQNKFN